MSVHAEIGIAHVSNAKRPLEEVLIEILPQRCRVKLALMPYMRYNANSNKKQRLCTIISNCL